MTRGSLAGLHRSIGTLTRRHSKDRARPSSASEGSTGAQLTRHTLVVNGEHAEVCTTPSSTLLEVLRGQLRLMGTKEACGRGECGACTVLLGSVPVMACTVLAQLADEPVTTIEGLDHEARDLREAFADHGGFQCGFCTPGQIVRAEALLRTGRPLDEATVRSCMAGNFCRCTGYAQIVDAVLATAAARGSSAATDDERRSTPGDDR